MNDIRILIESVINQYYYSPQNLDFFERIYIKSAFIELFKRDINFDDLYDGFKFIHDCYSTIELMRNLPKRVTYHFCFDTEEEEIEFVNAEKNFELLVIELEDTLKEQKTLLIEKHTTFTSKKRKVKI